MEAWSSTAGAGALRCISIESQQVTGQIKWSHKLSQNATFVYLCQIFGTPKQDVPFEKLHQIPDGTGKGHSY